MTVQMKGRVRASLSDIVQMKGRVRASLSDSANER